MLPRIVTGLIMAIAAIALTGYGPAWGSYALFQLAAFVLADEFYSIVLGPDARRERWVGMGYIAGVTAVAWWAPAWAPTILLLGAPILLTTALFSSAPVHVLGPRSAFLVTGAYYLGLPLACLMGITAMTSGPHYLLALFATIFAGDTGAFFAGRFLGKTKLYEKISPNKTREGLVGGALASVLGFFIVIRLFELPIPTTDAALLGLGCGLAGAIGDLVESMFKRSFNVKDSGAKLPGHGGLLDRVDGLLFGAPILWTYLVHTGVL